MIFVELLARTLLGTGITTGIAVLMDGKVKAREVLMIFLSCWATTASWMLLRPG